MTREEAIAIAHSDPEIIVEVLLQLSARIEELERKVAQLTKDSSNSSKPPSSDGPASKPKPRPARKSRKRKPGGQPGHKGKKRELVPVEDVTRIEEIVPAECGGCRQPFGSEDLADGGKYLRYQTVDLPEIKPEVTEYRLRCVPCACGAETWAQIPPHARLGFGPRLSAFAAYLTGVHRVTRRGVADVVRTIFGIDMSVGSVCNLHQEVSRAIEAPCEEIREALPQQPVLNVDETGWRSMGSKVWLWIFVASSMVYFTVSRSRGSKVLKEILGEVFPGILCSDRLGAYKSYHKGLRQVCWAHIIREIKGIRHACRSPDAVRFSRWMLREVGRMFGLVNALREERLDRNTLVLKSVPVRARMSNCLQTYELSSDADVARMARGLLTCWDHLFTFLEHEGVEPTNNAAERGIRPAVQWRKICFGNRSEDGEWFTARLLTVTRTCLAQHRNPFDYLVRAIQVHRMGLQHPCLVNTSR